MNRTVSVLSGLAGFVLSQLGGWDTPLYCLVSVMAADFVLGLGCGICGKSAKTTTGKLSSYAGMRGIFKKLAVLLGVFLGVLLDLMTNANCLREMVIISFFCTECISIIENMGKLGVKVPNVICKAIDALEDKNNEQTKQND